MKNAGMDPEVVEGMSAQQILDASHARRETGFSALIKKHLV